jgi:sulfur carrier protein
MNLTINGQTQTIETPQTLLTLLSHLGYDIHSIAVALDGQFIPRSFYTTTLLNADQSLEILSPMQGG